MHFWLFSSCTILSSPLLGQSWQGDKEEECHRDTQPRLCCGPTSSLSAWASPTMLAPCPVRPSHILPGSALSLLGTPTVNFPQDPWAGDLVGETANTHIGHAGSLASPGWAMPPQLLAGKRGPLGPHVPQDGVGGNPHPGEELRALSPNPFSSHSLGKKPLRAGCRQVRVPMASPWLGAAPGTQQLRMVPIGL